MTATPPDSATLPSADALRGARLVIVGAGSGIGRAIARAAAEAGAALVLAGRDKRTLEWTAAEVPGHAETITVDLADEATIAALAARTGRVDHVISTASAAANGPLTALDSGAIHAALAAKVTGPLLLAKHFADSVDPAGSMLFFSGVVAWRPLPQRAVMAATNGALAHLVQALALDLAPVRVNAIAPGIVDSGAWDGMGADKTAFLDAVGRQLPARRVGTPADLAHAAVFALTNPFTTGTVLHVDGGGRIA